jgi:GDP-L-fucose synthase
MKKNKFKENKILLTGGNGFLGKYVKNLLLKKGLKEKNIVVPDSNKFDLRDRINCQKLTKGIDIVIHLAGNVGGIGKNSFLPGTLLYDNAIMGLELMEAAKNNHVHKFVCIGTVCSYPKNTPVPFKEESLWNGYPEETNAPYGIAKKILLVQSQAYRQQFGFNSIYLLPVNLYGPGDNFDPKSSHVIPALIKKIHEAKKTNSDLSVWGTGKASREFLYVEDAAEAIVRATQRYNKINPINIGSSSEIKIKDLVTLIANKMNYRGKIVWNKNRPDGQIRRKLNTQKAKNEFGFVAKTKLDEGLTKTINWYIKTFK